jgi:hypothetical protein
MTTWWEKTQTNTYIYIYNLYNIKYSLGTIIPNMLETNHQAETDPNKIDLAHQFVTVTEIGPAPRG